MKCGGCNEVDIHPNKSNTYKGRCYCIECLDEELRDDLIESQYNPPFKIRNHDAKNKLIMGMELETEIYEEEDCVGIQTRKFKNFLEKEGILDFYHIKGDCSLDYGIELITQPFSLEYIKKNHLLAKTLNELRKRKFDSENESGNAGIHIHIDRSYFSNPDLIKMRLFFALNQEYLWRLSGRYSKDNEYCEYEEYDYYSLMDRPLHTPKYSALNLGLSNTVEIRIFNSTLNYKRIMGYFEFVESICKYVKETSIHNIVGGDKEFGNSEESWKRFVNYSKKYRYLTKLLKGVQNVDIEA